jgi:hypothetical protein
MDIKRAEKLAAPPLSPHTSGRGKSQVEFYQRSSETPLRLHFLVYSLAEVPSADNKSLVPGTSGLWHPHIQRHVLVPVGTDAN